MRSGRKCADGNQAHPRAAADVVTAHACVVLPFPRSACTGIHPNLCLLGFRACSGFQASKHVALARTLGRPIQSATGGSCGGSGGGRGGGAGGNVGAAVVVTLV